MPEAPEFSPDTAAKARRGCAVIFNPAAGIRRRRRLRSVLAALPGLGTMPVLCETASAGDATDLAREAGGYGIVVAAGGDGTINEVVNGLCARGEAGASRGALAIVPLGTANVLALELGLDMRSPENVATAIAQGQARPASLGVVNGRRFVVMAGVGFDARVVANVNVALKRRLGKGAYVLSSLLELLRYRPRTYRVSFADRVETVSSLVVANGRYYGGSYRVAMEASVDVPALHAVLFKRTGRWPALRYMWGMLSGRLARFPDVEVVAVQALRVEAGAHCGAYEPIQGDGDIIGVLPADVVLEREGISLIRRV